MAKGYDHRESVAYSGGAAAASLDTEALTQRGKDEDRHNSTAKRLRLLTPRAEWLADVQQATATVREQSARKLEARGRALARDRLVWSPGVEREELTDRPQTGRAEPDGSASRIPWERIAEVQPPLEGEGPEWIVHSKKGERSRALELRRRVTRWHGSRAKTKRELFARVDACGSAEATKITLVCRGCKTATPIEVGCGSKWFCPTCRLQQVVKFRKDFNRKRLGLVTAATRAGYTRRNQKKGERWGERLVTFTLPPRGTPQERIEVLRATWQRFWRLLGDRLRFELDGLSSISFDDLSHNFPNGRPGEAPEFVPLADLLSYLHVFEWTPGKVDGLGHPHLHVWMFSRYLDNREVLHPLWTRAYYEVRRKMVAIGPIEQTPLLIPDVRAANQDVDRELIKYLTKDWEISDTGAKRAEPEVFAQVYAKLDGKRLKQSSAGFAKWAVEKANVCPCCGYENERGNWARVDIEHALEESKVAPIGVTPPDGLHWDPESGRYIPAPLTGAAEYELRARFDAKRDSEWLESFERRIVAATMAERLER